MCLLLDVLHRNWKKNVSQNSIHKLNLNNKKTRSDCVFRCQQRSWISNTYVKCTTKPIWLTRNKSMIWFFVNEWLLKWLKEYIFFWKDEFTTEWYQTHAKRKQKKSQHCPSSNRRACVCSSRFAFYDVPKTADILVYKWNNVKWERTQQWWKKREAAVGSMKVKTKWQTLVCSNYENLMQRLALFVI